MDGYRHQIKHPKGRLLQHRRKDFLSSSVFLSRFFALVDLEDSSRSRFKSELSIFSAFFVDLKDFVFKNAFSGSGLKSIFSIFNVLDLGDVVPLGIANPGHMNQQDVAENGGNISE